MMDVYIRNVDLNKWVRKYFENKELISIDELLSTIEDLDGEIEELNEKIKQLEYEMHEFYRPISKSEMYDV